MELTGLGSPVSENHRREWLRELLPAMLAELAIYAVEAGADWPAAVDYVDEIAVQMVEELQTKGSPFLSVVSAVDVGDDTNDAMTGLKPPT